MANFINTFSTNILQNNYVYIYFFFFLDSISSNYHSVFSLLEGLCSWAINIIGFYEVYCDVEPKRKALAAANAELAAAQEKLAKIKAKIQVSINYLSTSS